MSGFANRRETAFDPLQSSLPSDGQSPYQELQVRSVIRQLSGSGDGFGESLTYNEMDGCQVARHGGSSTLTPAGWAATSRLLQDSLVPG
jgi:hypothetical protein